MPVGAGKHKLLYLFLLVMVLAMLKEIYEDAKEKTETGRGLKGKEENRNKRWI